MWRTDGLPNWPRLNRRVSFRIPSRLCAANRSIISTARLTPEQRIALLVRPTTRSSTVWGGQSWNSAGRNKPPAEKGSSTLSHFSDKPKPAADHKKRGGGRFGHDGVSPIAVLEGRYGAG